MKRPYADKEKNKRARFNAKHPELAEKVKKKKQRTAYLKSTYGMSYEDYQRLYAIQGGRCAVCRRTSETYLSVDHCHETERVRGLLCRDCNWALGVLREDPLIALAMVRYIEDRCLPAKRKGPVS